jgi:hypothetical protein
MNLNPLKNKMVIQAGTGQLAYRIRNEIWEALSGKVWRQVYLQMNQLLINQIQ